MARKSYVGLKPVFRIENRLKNRKSFIGPKKVSIGKYSDGGVSCKYFKFGVGKSFGCSRLVDCLKLSEKLKFSAKYLNFSGSKLYLELQFLV